MSTVGGTLTRGAYSAIAEWSLGSGDTGVAVNMSEYPDKTVQNVGSGSTVTIEGSNDGTNFTALNDTTGTPISLADGVFAVILENPKYIRAVAAGAAAVVTIVGARG